MVARPRMPGRAPAFATSGQGFDACFATHRTPLVFRSGPASSPPRSESRLRAGAGGAGPAAVDSRRIRPPPAVVWRGAREARDGDGGRGGSADAGRALREAGPEAAQARSERDERTPRNGPRGRVRRGVRPTRPPGSRRSRTRDAPGRFLREGSVSAKTGSEMRGEERDGARTRMGSRAGGGEGGLHAAEPTSAARPPRPGFAERPRISEHRALGARSRAGGCGRISLAHRRKWPVCGLPRRCGAEK